LGLASCTTIRREIELRPDRDSIGGIGLPAIPVSTLVVWGPLLPIFPDRTPRKTARFRLVPPRPPLSSVYRTEPDGSAAPVGDECPRVRDAERLPNLLEEQTGCRYRCPFPLDSLHLAFDSLRASIPYRATTSWSWRILPVPWPVAKAWIAPLRASSD